MNKYKFFFGKNSDEELKKISLLLNNVFKKKFSFDYLKWLYKDNPRGQAITFNISKNKKIIGHYAAIPKEIIINNKIHKAALSLNIAVDQEFRKRGFFKLMATEIFKKCVKRKKKFTFVVSNHHSTKLFQKYFNFKNFGELNVFLGFKKIKQKNNKQKFKIHWRKKDLEWRLKNPKENYSIKANIDGRLYLNKKLFNIIDINMGEFENKNFLTQKKVDNSMDLFNVYIGLGKYLNKNSFYFKLPKILKPSPLFFNLKNLTEKKNIFKLQRKDIFFQLIDFDAF